MSQTLKRPTLRDVAKLSNCSIAVVSTVINNAKGNTNVGDAMRHRVKDAANQLGYRPHFASQSLKEKRSRTLGVYFPPAPWATAGKGYEGAMIRGMELACREANFDLLLINMTGDQKARACIDKFAESRIDGLVLMSIDDRCEWISDLLEINSNVVAVDYAGRMDRLHAMQFDNAAAVRIAIEHLASLGHRRIGFIASCKTHLAQDMIDRKAAFFETLGDMELDWDERLVFDEKVLGRTVEPDEASNEIEGKNAVEHFVSLGNDRPTAIIGSNDLAAIAAMHRLMAMGLQVPTDMSVVGIDSSEIGKRVYPKLTSVSHPLEDMGYTATKFLIQQSGAASLRDKSNPFRQTFGATLVVRDSTSGPNS